MQGVELTPSHMRVNVVMANDRIGAMVQNGTLPANTPRNPDQMREFYGLQPNYDSLPQDLMRIRAFNGRNVAPSDFFDRDSAQALVNLNSAQLEPGNILLDSVNAMNNQSQFDIGESARIRRIQSTQPFNPEFSNPIEAERDSRNNRRARRRNQHWENTAPDPTPSLSSIQQASSGFDLARDRQVLADGGYLGGDTSRNAEFAAEDAGQDYEAALMQQRARRADREAARAQRLEAEGPWTPESGRVPEFNDAPTGMSLDEFLEYRESFARGNTVAGAQPSNPTPTGSLEAATARPENRIRRRRRSADNSASRWNTAPLVPEIGDIPF